MSAKPHYTFRVNHKRFDWGEKWFVNLLTGPDNTSDYTYVGEIRPNSNELLKLTPSSKFGDNTLLVKLLRRVLARIWTDEQAIIESTGFKLHHEGRCARCGKPLTVPASVESGFGPECINKV